MHIVIRVAAIAAVAVAGTAVAVRAVAPAQAANCTVTWVGPAGGDWATAANWSPAAVPDASSTACVTSTAGPKVASGFAATADRLELTGGAVTVNGTLTVNDADITNSTLSGAGSLVGAELNGRGSGLTASGLRVFGSVSITGWDGVVVTGLRPMCGSRMSVCLGGTSRIQTRNAEIDDGVIGGNTQASPAVDIQFALLVEGSAPDRITVDTSVPELFGTTSTTASLEVDRWRQLSPDGTLSVNTYDFNGPLIVGRTIVTLIGTNLTFTNLPDARTVDGASALRELTAVTGSGYDASVTLPADVQPQGGTLTVARMNTLGVGPDSSSVVHGAIATAGKLSESGYVHADSLVSTGAVYVNGTLTADHITIQRGSAELAAATFGGSSGVTFTNTSQLAANDVYTCGQIQGPLTMTGNTQLFETFMHYRPLCGAQFTVSGPVQLPPTLRIKTKGQAVLGDRHVLFNATGGITNTFTTIVNQNYGSNHWQIDYTATQVVATLVVGNV